MLLFVEIKKIQGKTFCIDTGMTYIPFYKIDNENIIMLDTGWADGEKEGLANILENNSFKIAGIINSHAHIDHSGNDAYFKEKYNCPIAMPTAEAMICNSAINLKLYYSTLSLEEIFAHLGHMICHVDMLITPTQNSIEMCGVKFKNKAHCTFILNTNNAIEIIAVVVIISCANKVIHKNSLFLFNYIKTNFLWSNILYKFKNCGTMILKVVRWKKIKFLLNS